MWLVLLWLGCCVIFPGRWMVASDGGRVVTPRCGVASVLSITSLWLLCSRVIAAYGGCIVTSPSGGIVTSLSDRIVTSLSGRFVASVSTIPSTRAVPIFGWRRSILFRRAIIIHVILTFVRISP